jgi:autotransporter family porin
MPDGAGTITNQGTITGTDDYGVEIGDKGTVTNDLLIQGANGVYTGGLGALTNDGTVDATGGTGVSFGDGGKVTNDAGETIEGTSGGVVMTSATGTIINDGKISASSGVAAELASGGTVSNAAGAEIEGEDYGVWMPDGTGTITNHGTITGTDDYGVEIGGNDANVTNSGTIQGATGVAFGGTGGTLTTSGEIVGTGGVAVNLAAGNTLNVDPGATFVGEVIDPSGSDTLELSGGAPGTLTGLGTSILGFGAVAIDEGASWTLPGNSSINVLDLNGAATVAAGGSLDVGRIDPGSTGVLNLAADATLEIGAAPGGQTRIGFLGDDARVIDHASALGTDSGSAGFGGLLLTGFAGGDTIDLTDIAPDGLHLLSAAPAGHLELTDSSDQIVASLRFETSTLAPGTFRIGSDGHSGTLITLS